MSAEHVRQEEPAAPPQYLRLLGGRGLWIQSLTLVVVVVLVLSPILPTLFQSVLDRPIYELAEGGLTWSNYVDLFTDAGFGRVVLNSLIFAVLTTLLAMVIGVSLAVLLVRTEVPGGRIARNILIWPIYISPLVLAFSFIFVYGPSGFLTIAIEQTFGFSPWKLYTIPGMAVTEAVAAVPFAYLYCSSALQQVDASLEDAARCCGARPFRVLRSVILPLLRPAVLYSALLIFSIALESLSIPLLYGAPVGITFFSSFVYVNGVQQVNPDYGMLGAASTLTLLLLVVLVTLQGYLLRNSQRFVSVRGKATRPRRFNLGKVRWPAFALVWLYILLGPVLPLAALVLRAFTQILSPLVSPLKVLTLDNVRLAFSQPEYVGSVVNSIVIALVGSTVTTLLAAVAVLVVKRSDFKIRKPIEFLSLAPQALPGIIIGLGFFWAFALAGPLGAVRSTILALIIAFCMRALPQAYAAISPVVMQVGRELDQAARVMGADWWYTFSRVLVRLITPALLASYVLVFVQMIKEFTPAVFLATAETNVIGTTSLELWQNGQSGAVAALSIVQIAIVAVFVFFAGKLLKVRTHA